MDHAHRVRAPEAGKAGTTRRDLVALAVLVLPTAACGFRPVFGGGAAAASPGVASRLGAVSVQLIPDRSGQLLQQALQVRLDGASELPRRYMLQASFSVASDAVAIQEDSSVTHIRLTGTSEYTLTTLDSRRTVTSGTARAVDGLDVVNQQYFAEDLETEQVVARLASALADQVALQLAVYFSNNANA